MTEQEFYSLYKKTETVDQRAKRMKEKRDEIEALKEQRYIDKIGELDE
jgi:hypothetical protein